VTDPRRLLGEHAERRAGDWYRAQGYEVLDRNWRCRDGEIDLVLRKGSTVVFSEVKARSSTAYGTPAEAVTPAKQRRIRRLAVRWLREHDVRAAVVRFDVVAVLAGRVEVIEAAF
jgi:putative endonuclease